MNTIAIRLFPLLLCAALTVHAQDSRLGTFHAERAVDGSARTALESNRLTVTISGSRTTAVSSITKLLPYDVGPPAVGVFESGACVLVDGFQGTFEFYDPSGNLLRTVSPLKEALPELERVMPFAVHDSSLTVAVSEPGLAGIQLFRFTERGEPVFSVELNGEFASGVVVSNSGTLTAVGSSRWNGALLEHTAFVVSASGVVKNIIPVACSFGTFSQDDSLLFVATTKEFALLSVNDGNVRSRVTVGTGRIALDAAPHDRGFIVLSAAVPALQNGHWRYQDLRIERLDSDGTRLAVPGSFQQRFESARLKRVDGDVLLQIDGVLQRVR